MGQQLSQLQPDRHTVAVADALASWLLACIDLHMFCLGPILPCCSKPSSTAFQPFCPYVIFQSMTACPVFSTRPLFVLGAVRSSTLVRTIWSWIEICCRGQPALAARRCLCSWCSKAAVCCSVQCKLCCGFCNTANRSKLKQVHSNSRCIWLLQSPQALSQAPPT